MMFLVTQAEQQSWIARGNILLGITSGCPQKEWLCKLCIL